MMTEKRRPVEVSSTTFPSHRALSRSLDCFSLSLLSASRALYPFSTSLDSQFFTYLENEPMSPPPPPASPCF